MQIAVEWLRQSFSKRTCSPVLSCDSDCGLQVPDVNRIVVVALNESRDWCFGSKFFSILALMIFLSIFKVSCQRVPQNRRFSTLGRRDRPVWELQFV